jgi:hypothetical protein
MAEREVAWRHEEKHSDTMQLLREHAGKAIDSSTISLPIEDRCVKYNFRIRIPPEDLELDECYSPVRQSLSQCALRRKADANGNSKAPHEMALDSGRGGMAVGGIDPVMALMECGVIHTRIVYSTRLMGVSGLGVLWGIAAAIWRARRTKTPTSQV